MALPPATAGLPEKLGAGFFFVCQGECLLLRRSPTSGNPLTLGLPGGNADPGDAGDLMATALRETFEEVGPAPPHTVKGSFLTMRGKRQQKHFTVFLAEVDPAVRATWKPVLNEEHFAYEWMTVQAAAGRKDLHPIVKKILREEPHCTQLMRLVADR